MLGRDVPSDIAESRRTLLAINGGQNKHKRSESTANFVSVYVKCGMHVIKNYTETSPPPPGINYSVSPASGFLTARASTETFYASIPDLNQATLISSFLGAGVLLQFRASRITLTSCGDRKGTNKLHALAQDKLSSRASCSYITGHTASYLTENQSTAP
ncbi:hypothetical protein WAI453_005839 [Rhynchosporium graminicola]